MQKENGLQKKREKTFVDGNAEEKTLSIIPVLGRGSV